MMSSFELILRLLMGLLSISSAVDGREFLAKRPVPQTTIYVDPSGSGGKYSSVQKAIDSVPDNNGRWIRIYIKQGTYTEMVKIPSSKQYILMEGETYGSTIIQYGAAGNSITSATFQLYADNFVAWNITFKNTHDIKKGGLTWTPAAVIAADKVSFHQCRFYGFQDTIGDMKGRHYFYGCYISGIMDFIWGYGQSVYKLCVIETVASSTGVTGYITAQGRESADDPSGFVFVDSAVKGQGHTYLGRAYRQYSRVIFYKTSMSEVVLPKGWSSWHYGDNGVRATYAEVECTGQGAKKTERVKWMKDLSAQELRYFLSNSFINQDDWMQKQPLYVGT